MRTPGQTSLVYIVFYKPYGVLSQFTPDSAHQCLRDFGPFPPDVYPVGRLDAESEGLLLLTNDNTIQHRATDPRFKHPRTYVVQVERVPNHDAIAQLRSGVTIEGKRTKPAEVELLVEEPQLPPRPVPIRFRKTVPTAWLQIILREGRNRQVRRMTATVGFPALRLVRIKIGELTLEGLQPGMSRNLTASEVTALKKSLGLNP